MVAFILSPKNSGLRAMRDRAFGFLKNTDKAKIIELRGEDIPFMAEEYARKGKNAIGLTGEDLFREYCQGGNGSGLQVIERVEWNDPEAVYGKPTLCLLGPKGKKLSELPKSLSVCISAKYRNTAESYLRRLEGQGFLLRKIYVSGCVETGYSEGISDLAIDIVYSGATMERNGLEVYEKIQESDFVILSGKTGYAGVSPRQGILGISEYSPPLGGRKGKLRLDFNENTAGCSPKVLEAFRKIGIDDISSYPEYESFTSELAAYLKVGKNELLPTNGSDEAIKLVMDVFVEAGDEVVIPEPTFKLFGVYAQMAGAKISKVLYNEDLSFPTENIIQAMDSRPKLLVLVSPNSPTGTAISEADLERILGRAKNSTVLLDEAYWQYCGKSAKEKIWKFPNLIIMQTFSKAFGLAGLRLGYLVANPGTIRFIKKGASPYSVNTIAMKAGQAAMQDADFVENYVAEVRKNREYVSAELEALGIKTYPSEANFIVARFGENAATICRKLSENGVLVRDVGQYPLLGGCLRITIGTSGQCEILLNRVKSALRPQALIFDMDGVLVDVSGSYRLAIKKTAEYFTWAEVGMQEIQEFKERGDCNNDWDLTEAIILKRGKKVEKEKIVEKFQEIFEGENLAQNEKLLLKIAALPKLRNSFRLGIVTGRPRKEALATLKKFGIEGFFDAVVTGDDIPKAMGKPNPCGIETAIGILGAQSACYFGDAVDDMEAAVRAKITAIGVLPPLVKSTKLAKLLAEKGAVKVVKNVDEALEGFT